MTYVRAGTISEQPSLLTRVLDIPTRIYQFLLFFVMTLIDPAAAKKASQMSNRNKGPTRKLGGMNNLKSAGGSCAPGG